MWDSSNYIGVGLEQGDHFCAFITPAHTRVQRSVHIRGIAVSPPLEVVAPDLDDAVYSRTTHQCSAFSIALGVNVCPGVEEAHAAVHL